MKEIEFHFNVPDKLAYSCRLLRKAVRGGSKAVVTAEPAVLHALDRLLWTFSPTEFLPHCMAGSAEITLAATPVLLAETLEGCGADSVLINLGQGIPADFARFERFIEVVSADEDDRIIGRKRWKLYQAQGHALTRHDASASREPA